MKTSFILSVLLLLTAPALFSQSSSWRWARSQSTIDMAYTEGTTTDASGNVYITGSFSTFMYLGDTILKQDTTYNTNNMIPDMYVAKYDSGGHLLWASSAQGSKNDMGRGVATDAQNNVYVTGYFTSDTFRIGPYTLYNHGPNYADIFLAKYDSSGRVLWARSAGMENGETPYAITTDPSGNVYIAGSFLSKKLVFGTDTLVNATTTGTLTDIFIAKYDPSGNVLWCRRDGGNKSDAILSLACDRAGNLYAGGTHNSASIQFDSITVAGSIYGSNNLMVSYTPSGAVRWAKGIFGAGNEMVTNGVAVDKDFNIYSTGLWNGYSRVILAPGDTLPQRPGGTEYDLFVIRQDSGGRYIWSDVSRSGSTAPSNTIEGQAIFVDQSDNVFVSGWISDSTLIGGTLVVNNGQIDGFVTKLDSTHQHAWTKAYGGAGYVGFLPGTSFASHSLFCMTGDRSGHLYIGGSTVSEYIFFDSATIIGTTPSYAATNGSGYLARLDAGIRTSVFATFYDTICQGASASIGAHHYSTTGTYTGILTTSSGADSVVTLHLFVWPPAHSTLPATICAGSSYTFHGHILSVAGTYYDTLTAASGCDSIVTLQLTIVASVGSSYAGIICTGASVSFGGHQLSAAGTYYDTLIAAAGCDSIVTLTLHVSAPIVSSSHVWLCRGASYYFGGQSLSVTGIYYDTLSTVSGCDSICILDLSATDTLHALFTLQPAATLHEWYVVDHSIGYGLHYSWSWGDGSPVDLTTTPSHTYDSAGYYTICLGLTDTLGCQASYCDSGAYLYKDATGQMIYVNVTEAPTGITAIGYTAVGLYPDPNAGNFVLSAPGQVGSSYYITDLTGRKVAAGDIADRQQAIYLDVSSGMYLLRIDQAAPLRFEIIR